jgi:hypothetical protein
MTVAGTLVLYQGFGGPAYAQTVVVDGKFSITGSVCTPRAWELTIGNATGGLSCYVTAQVVTPADCGCYAQPPAGVLAPGAGCDAGTGPDSGDGGPSADAVPDAPAEAPAAE